MTARRMIWEKNGLIELFQANESRLIQVAQRIVGCRCLAEDIVQDTMVKLCEKGIDEDVQSPAAYLFRMVRNLSIDCARRRMKERGLSDVEEGVEFSAPCPCPETQMAHCQALRLVMAALQELPERTRHAFEMHRINGVSQRDIATQMHVSPTLVNFMVRDAHNHCRSKLLSHRMDSDLVPEPAGRQANPAPRLRPSQDDSARITSPKQRKPLQQKQCVRST